MSWIVAWKALSGRINGLLDAGTFFFSTLRSSSEDYRSVQKKVLLASAKGLFDHLEDFLKTYKPILPSIACDSIEHFLENSGIRDINFNEGTKGVVLGNVQLALTSFAAFRSEFDYLIADTQIVARKITERAFIHLQRSIMVDDELRKKWEAAFEIREEKCEQLGAVHLLSHGVWPFKVHADGGRTDLIMNEPITSDSEIEKAADTLVLTEWKRVRKEKDLNKLILQAKEQADLYSSGILGGIELRNYRYLVMISKNILSMPEDRKENGIIYKHINVAVSPSKQPSTTSKKSTRKIRSE